MGKVDVVKEIYASADLIRDNYKEMAVPLIILLLLSGGGGMGGSSFGDMFERGSGGGASAAAVSDSLVSNAIFDSGAGLLVLAIVSLVVLAVGAVTVFSEALWLYVYHFFHSLLRKKKISEDWKSRMKRFSLKAAVLLFFWLAITVAIFALPAWQVWQAFSSADISDFSDLIAPLLASLFWLAAGFAGMLFIGFFLAPLWVYYAMDGRGFFESISSSVALVSGNIWAFLTLSLVFFGIGIATVIATFASVFCCLAWLVSPVLSVASSLLYGVALMRVKMALEK